jgi:hypothetical protein
VSFIPKNDSTSMRLKSMMEANTIVSTENEKKFKKKKIKVNWIQTLIDMSVIQFIAIQFKTPNSMLR